MSDASIWSLPDVVSGGVIGAVLARIPAMRGEDDATSDHEEGLTAAGVAGGDADPLPLDQLFEVIKNERRRETLHYLREHDGEGSLSDLAEHIAALENDTTVARLSSKQRKRVYVGLYQCHLPKMDAIGVVDFEQNRGTVQLTDRAEQLYPYLEESERSWHRLYGAVSLAGAGLFLGVVLLGATSTVIVSLVLVAIIVTVGACAIAQAYATE